ncbi:hypothetical protein [Sinimarinibacterium thermocellulolyticum]|uniref:BIG2 domain-containing protein n=1 Tax=Sinimarinibacterium thermocellulolyticum TaxID=3170016 RepID=A0ABV2ADK0_9GAMM
MRMASLRCPPSSPILAAALLLAACGEGSLRSPDLPPPVLTGIGQVSCNLPGPGNSLAVGQQGQCQVVGGCTYRRVDENGDTQSVVGVCPDLSFGSSAPDVAPIDPDSGVLTGAMPGTTTITASGGGITSGGVTVTVNEACGSSLTASVEPGILVSGNTTGTQANLIATLTFSDGTTQDVSDSPATQWTADPDGVVIIDGSLAQAEAHVEAVTPVTITATYTGNVCGPAGSLQASDSAQVRPAQIASAQDICIETVPPAGAFGGCRADSGACLTPDQPIRLGVGGTAQLQIRGRFNVGLTNAYECNITASTTLATGNGSIATVDGDTAVVTGTGPGNTTVVATFDGLTNDRPVTVVVERVLGNNSLAVFAKSGFDDGDMISLADAQTHKFACVGANNLLIDGLGNRTPRAALKVFAFAATCASTDLDDDGNCTALPPPDPDTGEQGEPSAAAFLATAPTQNVSNLPPRSTEPGADPYDDGIVWNSVAGYWAQDPETGAFRCMTEASAPSANVGDLYTPGERVLVDADDDGFPDEPAAQDGLPQGALQPNGLAYADAAVRVGFNCVTATYTNPADPSQTRTDGMTVLVLPVTNDILLSGSNDGNALCEALAPLFGSNSLLGIVEVTNVLSAVTSGLSPLLETLDAVPIDSLVTTLQGILGPITAPLIDTLDEFLISPVLEPLACQLTNAVEQLLAVLTNNPAVPQECGTPGPP